jgi:hypothetical protein
LLPSRTLVNAIFVPSGDQAGSRSSHALSVSRRSADPSTPIEKSSLPAAAKRCVSNAMRAPSGDHAGSRSFAAVCVTGRGPLPSGATTQMLKTPRCPDSNATRRPSGDHAGAESKVGLRTMRTRPEPFALAIPMSPSTA